jgi:putative transposase
VTPAARRQAVAIAQQEHGLSRRRACRLIGIARSVAGREPKRVRQHDRLRERLRALAGERRRFGYRRLHELLRREGWKANHKLVHRLYREEKLALHRRGRQKRGGGSMAGHWCPIAANQRWSLDFTEDGLASGRRFRTANLKDDGTRECPAILVDFSLPGARVVAMLDAVARDRGYPDMLVVDNGPELRGRELDRWTYENGVKLFFIDPGKPMQNGSIESFNGRFREECLDPSWFTSLAEARRVIEAWRVDYNERRPHTSLRMRTPVVFAAARPFVKGQRPPDRGLELLREDLPAEAVAAIAPPMLSSEHGFP